MINIDRNSPKSDPRLAKYGHIAANIGHPGFGQTCVELGRTFHKHDQLELVRPILADIGHELVNIGLASAQFGLRLASICSQLVNAGEFWSTSGRILALGANIEQFGTGS